MPVSKSTPVQTIYRSDVTRWDIYTLQDSQDKLMECIDVLQDEVSALKDGIENLTSAIAELTEYMKEVRSAGSK